jgi:hypothetical protein
MTVSACALTLCILPCAALGGAGYCECAGQRVASNAVARACGETALIWHLRRGAHARKISAPPHHPKLNV